MENNLSNSGEQEFLHHYNPNDYEPLSISVDNLIFSIDCRIETNNYRKLDEQKLMVLLLKRKEYPFLGRWSLPGGFVQPKETLREAVIRVLNLKTGLNDLYLEQLYTFGNPSRDPRMRIVSCSYLSLIDRNKFSLKNLKDDTELAWFEVKLSNENNTLTLNSKVDNLEIPIEQIERQNGKIKLLTYTIKGTSELAFDHASIILKGLLRLRGKIDYSDIVFNLLPDKFTITQLQNIYEIILGQKLLKAAFRRKIADKISETGEYSHEKGHRPSQYFRYKSN